MGQMGKTQTEERTKLTNLEKRRRILLLRSNLVLSAPWCIYLQGYFSWNESSCLNKKLLHWWNYFTFHEKDLKFTISLIFRSLRFKIWSQQWRDDGYCSPDNQQEIHSSIWNWHEEMGDKFLYQARDATILPHWCCFSWTEPWKERRVESFHILQLHSAPLFHFWGFFVNTSHPLLWKSRLFLWCLCKEHLTELAKNLNLLSCFKL